MKKLIIKEAIKIHFGFKFSNLINEDKKIKSNLSLYSYKYIKDYAKELAKNFSIKDINIENSPIYNEEENFLISISVKNIKDVVIVYDLINKEIEKLNECLLYANKEKINEIAFWGKSNLFNKEIEEINKEIEITKTYKKLNDLSNNNLTSKKKNKI